MLHGDGGEWETSHLEHDITGRSSVAGTEASIPISPTHTNRRAEYPLNEEDFDDDGLSTDLSTGGVLLMSRRASVASGIFPSDQTTKSGLEASRRVSFASGISPTYQNTSSALEASRRDSVATDQTTSSALASSRRSTVASEIVPSDLSTSSSPMTSRRGTFVSDQPSADSIPTKGDAPLPYESISENIELVTMPFIPVYPSGIKAKTWGGGPLNQEIDDTSNMRLPSLGSHKSQQQQMDDQHRHVSQPPPMTIASDINSSMLHHQRSHQSLAPSSVTDRDGLDEYGPSLEEETGEYIKPAPHEAVPVDLVPEDLDPMDLVPVDLDELEFLQAVEPSAKISPSAAAADPAVDASGPRVVRSSPAPSFGGYQLHSMSDQIRVQLPQKV